MLCTYIMMAKKNANINSGYIDEEDTNKMAFLEKDTK